MKILFYKLLFVICLSSFPLISNAAIIPPFFDSIEYEEFFPNGIKEWISQKNSTQEEQHLHQWTNTDGHTIILKYRQATPNTIEAAYKRLGDEIDNSINKVGGNVLTINEFFAVILINDTESTHSVNLLYGTPNGAYWWKYKVPITFKTKYNEYIRKISFTARKHQYDSALGYGNVIMGRWGTPIHEFAKLLADSNDPKTIDVYKKLLQTSPANYDAQIEYTSITSNEDEAVQCAKIVARDAEEETLLNASATILGKKIPSISFYPLLQAKDTGLKVILVPLTPCNPWLLNEIAIAYEKITTIPVIIRRLPVAWKAPQPSRSAYRPYLEKIVSNFKETKSDFNDWSLVQLKEELIQQAKKEGPQAVTSIKQLFKKMDKAGYQWEADTILNWLSQSIVPFYSKDKNTMVVGITELDIYSGETNYVFSVFGGYEGSLLSLMSYAKMRAKLTGENQSRKRLVERIAKELVPASLKKLGIQRSLDPSCPYSYSSGLQRLEEKTLNLSAPVKKEISKIQKSI
jgi:predicted Zn-dependent protease